MCEVFDETSYSLDETSYSLDETNHVTVKVEPVESEITCNICADKNNNVKTTCCAVEVCDDCLSTWAKIKPSCPFCREPLILLIEINEI